VLSQRVPTLPLHSTARRAASRARRERLAVLGHFYNVCDSLQTPLTVDLFRGSTLVATSTGTAVYVCNGTTDNFYSVNTPGPADRTYAYD
jgi:hypothetical protein